MTTFFSQFADNISSYHPAFSDSFLGISLAELTAALVVFLALYVLFWFFQTLLLNRLHHLAKKTANTVDDLMIELVSTLHPSFYGFLAFYVSAQLVGISGFWETALNIVLVIWVVYQIVSALQVAVNYLVDRATRDEKNKGSVGAIRFMGRLGKWVVWLLALLFVLSNVGVDISSFIAGLGIGGIAIALALQNILSDLFSSFAIFFDKPFQIGDFITVGDKSGIVERIGIKTSRLRALQGEEIVISNKELTNARIQNFKKLQERRVVHTLGVTYDTAQEKLKAVPNYIKDIVTSVEGVRFDRAHFNSFGDSALMFELVYYVESDDYAVHMNTQQDILFAIHEKFAKEGIEFAFPSQTLYLHK